MKLMMYLRNDLIESITLDDKLIPLPGYVGSIKRNLKVKYQDLIMEADGQADFIVTNPMIDNTIQLVLPKG